MKKIISVLMCALLMFSLVACGGAGESTELSRGMILGNIYTNNFAGFTFTKPSGWDYLTDEEIAETINIGQNALDLNAIEEALAKKATIYDMAASDPAHGNSVMICYENTRLTAGFNLSEDDYIEQMKKQIQNSGVYDYEFIGSEDSTLSGTAFKKVVFKAYPEGIEINQAYYIKAIDNYIVAVIVTATTESVEAIEAMFDADADGSTNYIPTPRPTYESDVKAKISRGTINGDDYINSFAGFTFTKPADWVYLSDKEIAETVNLGQEALDLNYLEKALSEQAGIYDMAAEDPVYGSSVMVCYENIRLTNSTGISVDDYVDQLKNQILNSGVYDYEFIGSEETVLSGTPFKKVAFKASPEGVELSQAYYVRVIDNYMIAIIVTATNESIENIEAMFG